MLHLLGPTIFISLSLTAIVWLAQSLRFVDLIVNRGLSVGTFLYLTLLLMPSVLNVVLPVAAVCSCFYVLHKLTIDSELIVLRAVGLSPLQLARPLVGFSVGICLLCYAISLYILPFSYREFKDLQFFIRNNYASLLLQEGVFSTPMDGLTVFVREREDSGGFSGIMVHDARGTVPATMLAEHGQLIKTDRGPRFFLEKGLRQSLNLKRGDISFLQFDSYTLDISYYTEVSHLRLREAKERYLHELLSPEADASPAFRQELRQELHNRLSWPLTAITLPLLAVASMLTGTFNRRGQWQRIVGGAVLCALFLATALALAGLSSRYTWLIAGVYLVQCLGILAATTALWLHGTPGWRDCPKQRALSGTAPNSAATPPPPGGSPA